MSSYGKNEEGLRILLQIISDDTSCMSVRGKYFWKRKKNHLLGPEFVVCYCVRCKFVFCVSAAAVLMDIRE